MFVLLCWTQQEKNKYFFLFLLLSGFTGVGVEIAGVNTGAIFGDYSYGNVLGPKLAGVPMIIGINWFLIIYCCGVVMHTILMRAINRLAIEPGAKPMRLKALSVIVDGATLAVFFDWVMEPVAVKLGYWQWKGDIPFYNYFCWFMVSVLLLALFHFLPFSKNNKFAIHLLMIQLMFFLLLRTFL
jgi:putative membrane protein